MVTYCRQCKSNIDTEDACFHRKSLLRKLRLHSNEIVRITERLDSGEISEDEANEMAIASDERFANLVNRMYI